VFSAFSAFLAFSAFSLLSRTFEAGSCCEELRSSHITSGEQAGHREESARGKEHLILQGRQQCPHTQFTKWTQGYIEVGNTSALLAFSTLSAFSALSRTRIICTGSYKGVVMYVHL